MSNRVVVIAKDMGVAHIPMLRHINKLDSSYIHTLRTKAEKLEFVVHVVNDIMTRHNFQEFTLNGETNISPSEFYRRLVRNDQTIPGCYIATYKNGRYSSIEIGTTKGLAQLVNDDEQEG